MLVHHTGGNGLGDTGTVASGTGSAVGSGLLTAGAITGGPFTPVGMGLMIAGGAVILGSMMLHVFGVGVRNPYEDKDVVKINDLEILLQQNVAGWNSGTKTVLEQQQRLAAFDYYFGQLAQVCNDPGLGVNWATGCIHDREQGGKWDWYAMYRTPISSAVTSDSPSMVNSLATGGSGLYIGIGAVLAGLLLAKD